MRYVSTRGAAPILSFDDVTLAGLADDGGLYVPASWPALPAVPSGDYAAVAAAAMAPFLGGSVVADGFDTLVAETYAGFRHPDVAPLRHVDEGRYLLELFWGPTLSFKDYALQLLGGILDRILASRGGRVLILGATSGDTGSAAIEACRDRAAVDVVILYPHGRTSDVQRRQMTTVPAANVRAVAVDGTFDDCQDLVKAAFAADRERYSLAAVNSINWARIMAQAAYYVWVSARLPGPFAVSVPTGNFGNVFSAYVARRLGAPVERLIVGNNANHGLADLVVSGRLGLGPVVPTDAPAMDIAVPSNLERYLFELTGRDGEETARLVAALRSSGELRLPADLAADMRRLFAAAWVDDGGIRETIGAVARRYGIVLDPHTATAWAAADRAGGDGLPVVTVATAHPAKFPGAVEDAVGSVPALPPDLADLADRPERTEVIPGDLAAVRRILDDVAGR